MADWQKAKNGSDYISWENAPAEIKALLQNEDDTVNFKAKVPINGYIYNASEYKGKVKVWRNPEGNKKPADTFRETASVPKDIGFDTPTFTENPEVHAEGVEQPTINIENNSIVVETSKVIDFVAVKIGDVKAKLDEGYDLFGNNFNEAYRDGLVGLVKRRLVPVRVA